MSDTTSKVVEDVNKEEAEFTNIELVSDDEEESPEEDQSVVTYSCTLGDNVPCVIQALAGGEADTETQEAPIDNVCTVKEAAETGPVEDLITSCEGDDDFVAAPVTSKFVVNFTKADPEDHEDKADSEPRPEPESDQPVLTSADEKEVEEQDEEVKEDKTEIKQKVSTKDKIFNMLFGCFKSRKCNKTSS